VNSVGRTYLKEFGVAMLAYLIVLALSMAFVNANPGSTWRFVVVLAPVVPALFVVLAVVRHVRRLDELQRRIQLEALALAFPSSALVTFSYGLLQQAGLPPLNWTWVWLVMGSFWLLGTVVAARRYR
jgi:hypothetical protein